jgi:uncharacterized protein YoxC
MNEQILAYAAVIVGPAVAALVVFVGRRARQRDSQTDSISNAIEAVTDANVSITAMVQALMNPMKAEIQRVQASEAAMAKKLDAVNARVESMDAKFSAAIAHIRALHRIILHEGIDLPSSPPELDGLDLHD